MNFIVKQLIAILLRVDKNRVREMLVSLLEQSYSAADKTETSFDDIIAASALAIVKDDKAWSEIVDFLSLKTDV